jgi:hypothetical protein
MNSICFVTRINYADDDRPPGLRSMHLSTDQSARGTIASMFMTGTRYIGLPSYDVFSSSVNTY